MQGMTKTRGINPVATISGLVLLIFLNSLPAHAFRCGTRLISEGDSKFRVLSTCGDPTHIEIWEEERIYRDYRAPRHRDSENHIYRYPAVVKQLVTIERWTYNLGALKFIRYLIFENGSLVEITTGEHGY